MTAAKAEEIIFEKSSNTVFSEALAVYIIFILAKTYFSTQLNFKISNIPLSLRNYS